MSGSSMDGVDLALCQFMVHGYSISDWSIEYAETIPFSTEWVNRLSNIRSLSGEALVRTDREFGNYLGIMVQGFMAKNKIRADFLVSHGHTVYHHPPEFTFQLGHGANVSAMSGIPAIVDLRSMDLAHGGEGAPIAPLADEYLFPEYSACLNLGGIANISGRFGEERIAFDMLPCNQLLNWLAGVQGLDFDRNGILASTGKLDKALLEKLDQWPFLQKEIPRSLSNESISETILPIVKDSQAQLPDKLHTVTHWISKHIVQSLVDLSKRGQSGENLTVLCTGGGVWNGYLMKSLQTKGTQSDCTINWFIPEPTLVDFKEALLTALFGLFRYLNVPNIHPSWSGSKLPSVGGAIYWNKS